jgi:hypothetical protein
MCVASERTSEQENRSLPIAKKKLLSFSSAAQFRVARSKQILRDKHLAKLLIAMRHGVDFKLGRKTNKSLPKSADAFETLPRAT